MTANEEGGDRRPAWLGRFSRTRLPLAIIAAAFFLLFVFGALSGAMSVLGFLLVAAAVVIGFGADRGNANVAAFADRLARAVAGDDRESQIEELLAGIPDPVVVLAQTGDVIAFNPLAAAIAPELRRGEPLSLALRTPDLIDTVRRAAATRTQQRVEISERVPLDRWYEVIVTPVALRGRGQAPPAELLFVAFHDLTPLRRVEEMRADFVANASHELRTPLAALLGFVETLQGSARDDANARERFLAIMRTQAMRMARLIDDLLSLSRIELNAHRRPATPVDLISIVRQVADGLEMIARDRGVEIKLLVPDGPLIVAGDRDELARLFENLVENALKYGASGKRVEISAARVPIAGGNDEAIVAVRDYGPGIAPEHLPRLTERFYRVDVAESRAQGGTGLGLALVKHILNRHGGRLSVESVQGQGAAFTVHLALLSVEKTQEPQ